LALALLFAAAWFTTDARRPSAQYERVAVRAEAGDTAWSLARDYPVPGLTTAETAQLIISGNGIGSGPVQAGDVVLVPHVGDTSQVAMR
jgi:hypothetical protein